MKKFLALLVALIGLSYSSFANDRAKDLNIRINYYLQAGDTLAVARMCVLEARTDTANASRYYLYAAAFYGMVEDYRASILFLKEAITKDKFNSELWVTLAMYHQTIGEYSLAYMAAGRALQLDPYNGNGYLWQGHAAWHDKTIGDDPCMLWQLGSMVNNAECSLLYNKYCGVNK